MSELIRLIEKRNEVGARPWNGDKVSFNNKIELHNLDYKIVREVLRLYANGELPL